MAGKHANDDEVQFYLELLGGYLDCASDAIFVLCDEMKFILCSRVSEIWSGCAESELTRHNKGSRLIFLLDKSKVTIPLISYYEIWCLSP